MFSQMDMFTIVTPSETPDDAAMLRTTLRERSQGRRVQVYVASTLLYDHLDKIQGEARAGNVLIFDPRRVRNPAAQRLVKALASEKAVGRDLNALYVSAICVALISQLLGTRGDLPLQFPNRRPPPLPKWRLKRVVDHVDAHLCDRLTLSDLATAAGMTRMYFAAQFRVATGIRPREYIQQRRIERAQELLRDTKRTLVDVALSVGFQSQAYFTTVFRRFTDETPYRWRRAALEAARPAVAPQKSAHPPSSGAAQPPGSV
jgi:AraC-like DNA-binding protein